MPKSIGKKSRQSPSVERQLALALVALIEDVKAIPGDIQTTSVIEVLKKSTVAAQKVLDANGYSNLESVESRVIRIEADIAEAVRAQDGARLARLGAELDRAKSGKPPLATEKKPRKKKVEHTTAPPAEPTERKTRKRREAVDGVMCKCNVCDWVGVSTVGSACPVDGYLVVAQEG